MVAIMGGGPGFARLQAELERTRKAKSGSFFRSGPRLHDACEQSERKQQGGDNVAQQAGSQTLEDHDVALVSRPARHKPSASLCRFAVLLAHLGQQRAKGGWFHWLVENAHILPTGAIADFGRAVGSDQQGRDCRAEP